MTPSNSAGLKIWGYVKQRAIIFYGTELYCFEVSIGRNANFF